METCKGNIHDDGKHECKRSKSKCKCMRDPSSHPMWCCVLVTNGEPSVGTRWFQSREHTWSIGKEDRRGNMHQDGLCLVFKGQRPHTGETNPSPPTITKEDNLKLKCDWKRRNQATTKQHKARGGYNYIQRMEAYLCWCVVIPLDVDLQRLSGLATRGALEVAVA